MYYLYIVRCRDNSLYTGISTNYNKRIKDHNNSYRGAKSLRGKRPVRLVYIEKRRTLGEALKRESEIKGWSRKKKEELIEKE